jgi:hypothetical protein
VKTSTILIIAAVGVGAWYLYSSKSGPFSLTNSSNPQGVGTSLNSFLNFWGADGVTAAPPGS